MAANQADTTLNCAFCTGPLVQGAAYPLEGQVFCDPMCARLWAATYRPQNLHIEHDDMLVCKFCGQTYFTPVPEIEPVGFCTFDCKRLWGEVPV